MYITRSPTLDAAMFQREILEARRNGRPFSPRNVLVIIAEAVLSGAQIDPEFQALANAVIAEAIIKGKLPGMKSGRPAGSANFDELKVAGEYFELLDAGGRREDILNELEARHPTEKGNLWRIIKKGEMWHGSTKTARDQARAEKKFRDDHDPTDGRVELAGLEEPDALKKLQALIASPPQ